MDGIKVDLSESMSINSYSIDYGSSERHNFLTVDDLKKLDMEEPEWRKYRRILLFGFFAVWIILVLAAILSVVLAEQCPHKPSLSFWESGVGYWLNPLSFKDSGDDKIGDFRGLNEQLSYLKDTLGVTYIVMTSILSGEYTNEKSFLGLIDSYRQIDPVLGNFTDLDDLITKGHKKGIKFVSTLNFNAISITHSWVKDSEKLQSIPDDIDMPSRFKKSAKIMINGKEYYSVESPYKVDLNLSSPSVIEQIEVIITFWLEKGFDGILFTAAGFLMETFKDSVNQSWYSVYPDGQLFNKDNVKFTRLVRKIFDKFSGTERVIIFDSGNVGYPFQPDDKSLAYLEGADLVVSRMFVHNRGGKKGSAISTSVNLYSRTNSTQRPSLALVTATPTDVRSSDHTLTAYSLLLEGSPILYYGSELFNDDSNITEPPNDIFPMGKKYYSGTDKLENLVTCSLPMPWDLTGHGFTNANVSTAFTTLYGNFETVMHATAAGRGFTPFRMVQKLISLRSRKESLQFGRFEWLNETIYDNEKAELFVRRAEGFPAFIICIIKETSYRLVADFSRICPNVILHLMYPEMPNLSINNRYTSNAVYLKTDKLKAVFVFECA